MSTKFELNFELSSFKELDQFALTAVQQNYYGDKDNWFNLFRGGLFGMYARLSGASLHYNEIHSWESENFKLRGIQMTEYHLSSLFFNMESSIECMVFGVNALGYVVAPSKFLNITDTSQLRNISPQNIIGSSKRPGYEVYFPTFNELWKDWNERLIKKIAKQHNVSKHRSAIFFGGKTRSDPPVGFFKKRGINNDISKSPLVSPFEEILLNPDPTLVFRDQIQVSRDKMIKLEDVGRDFLFFINECGKALILDAKSKIELNENKLKT